MAVVDRSGSIVAAAVDERHAHGQNPVYCAAMLAMGRAGSAVNLREHALVVAADEPLGVHELGWSGVGACELFGPAAVVCAGPVMRDLREILERAGVRVFGAV